MSAPDHAAAASRLCTACGLCCNGVLFHIVRLQPSDSVKALEALGMKLSRKKREPYFNQPCRFLDGCTCQIYAARPARCRLFECRQIKGLTAEEISEVAAAEVIAQARAEVARVEALLAAHGNEEAQLPLLERCTQVLQTLAEADTGDLRAAMQSLNDLLNRQFRPEPVALP